VTRIAKRIVRRAFKLAGFEIVRSHGNGTVRESFIDRINNLRSDMGQCLTHLNGLGLKPATVIDVGVAFGTPELYEPFPDSQFLLVEPLREFKPFLAAIRSQYRARTVLAAAGPKNGLVEFCVTPDKTTSAVLSPLSSPQLFSRRKVACLRVDALCSRFGFSGPFVIKVDVQGYELSVLDGCTKILPQTEAVILEVNFFPFSQGIPELCEVLAYMKSLGFVAYDIFGGHNRPLDGARAQADVVFVKKDGAFRLRQEWGTEAQRKAFLDCKREQAVYAEIIS
jgi:FkbM family methyltransferase